jgi:hypothetical protein
MTTRRDLAAAGRRQSAEDRAEADRRASVDDLLSAAPNPNGTQLGAEHRPTPGGQWLYAPEPAGDVVWGHETEVLWASGEPLLVGGYPGAGKTTLAGAILAAATGLAPPSLLGFPFQRTFQRVLYLALDRPRQIRRALRRQLRRADVDALDAVLAVEDRWVWRLDKEPTALLAIAEGCGADAVFVDSVKDLVPEVDKPSGAETWLRATAPLLRADIEVMASVHVRKPTKGWPTLDLNAIYGGAGFGWGAGSVLLLQGPPGGAQPVLEQVKAPAEMVGRVPLHIDQERGLVALADFDSRDVAAVLGAWTEGITASDYATVAVVGLRAAQQRLQEAVRAGLAICEQGAHTAAGRTPNVYRLKP